jgi:hypothetical protein
MIEYMFGALVATAVPVVPAAPVAPKTLIVTPKPKASAPDLGTMLRMFDTVFPPQPAPDPRRLPLAHVTALALLPPNAMGEAVGGMMDGMVDRFLKLSESDLPARAGAKAGKPADPRTFRESMIAKDPFFDERMRLTRAAAVSEFKRFSAVLEPRLRDGIARGVARRFDQRQLAEINALFATDSGAALGRHFLGLWFDPDLMRSSIAAMPELIALMPGSMQRISAATAHLPKPPKPPKRPTTSKPASK